MTNKSKEFNSPEFKEFMGGVDEMSLQLNRAIILKLKEITTNENGMQLISAMLCTVVDVMAPMMALMPLELALEAVDAMVLDLKLALAKEFAQRNVKGGSDEQ